ncbi:Ribosome biogenesis protein BRX1-like 1 [Glycine soja]|uniref:Ribosome biogenesis protein BRX1-like 1 n=1 Tax=Glycine soja TaxID=3848 RepID=A0A445LLY1_GLYSO|nr:Ribosome biogenesis protein BRX1-like 1 [Glycine soja]
MGKKRKHSETTHDEAQPQKEDVTSKRPSRTLLGWKDKNEVTDEVEDNSPMFRSKEKVLVTCSRQINYTVCCGHLDCCCAFIYVGVLLIERKY